MMTLLASGCSTPLPGADVAAPPQLSEQSSERRDLQPLESRGPLMMRVDAPIFLIFPRLPSTNATPPKHSHSETYFTVHYSSLFRDHEQGNNSIRMDGEILQAELHSRFGLGDRSELFVTIPTLYGTSGFLDEFIEDYHDLISFPQDGRDLNPDDQFGFFHQHRGTLAYSLKEDRLQIGDISIGGGWLALQETEQLPAVQLRGAVQLPTGDEEDGFGSGGIDAVIGVALEKRFGTWFLHGLLDHSILGGSDRFDDAGLDDQNTWTGQLALEKQVGQRVSLLAQLRYETTPLGSSEPEESNDSGFLYSLGLFADLTQQTRLQLAFTEDINGKSIQDFTATAGLVFQF